jgi:hypothetical protein
MRNKSFANIIEMIMVVIVLYAAFSIFFPGFSYKNNWSKALLLLTARDVVVASDRIGKLYNYSFNQGALQDFLINSISNESIISWSDTDGAIKSQIIIACNCTSTTMVNLNTWMNGLNINGRQITTTQCYTNLEAINPCVVSSDVLIIWGEKNLSNPVYKNTIQQYLKGDGGIVEVADFKSPLNQIQNDIFDLNDSGSWASPDYDIVIKPTTADATTYQAYKIYTNGLKGNSSFSEFCKLPSIANKKIVPSDGDISKILAKVNTEGGQPTNATCAIFNSTKIAWISDFTDTTFDANHTKMLTSIILAASNKRPSTSSIPSTSIGYIIPYINVKNADMFEVYKFDLGLGYPY